MLSSYPVRVRRRKSVSLGRFQNCNLLEMDHFRQYGVEDESERAGDAKDSLPRVPRLWGSALSEIVIDIGTAHLQPAEEPGVSRAENLLPEDQAGAGEYRGAAAARSARQAWVPADRHGASGRSGRRQGGVPHQRGGRSDAVAGGGSHGANQRGLVDSGVGSDDAAVSVPHTRLPFRQWQRVHQSHGGEAAEQTAGGADKISAAALQRQCPGGSQERSGDPQTHGVRAYWGAGRGR